MTDSSPGPTLFENIFENGSAGVGGRKKKNLFYKWISVLIYFQISKVQNTSKLSLLAILYL